MRLAVDSQGVGAPVFLRRFLGVPVGRRASVSASVCCRGGTAPVAPGRLRACRQLRRPSAAPLSIGVSPRASSAPLRRARCVVPVADGARASCCKALTPVLSPHAPLSPPLSRLGRCLGLVCSSPLLPIQAAQTFQIWIRAGMRVFFHKFRAYTWPITSPRSPRTLGRDFRPLSHTRDTPFPE